MDLASEIKKALIEIIGANPNLPLVAKVVSVNNDTCSVKLNSGFILTDVRLNATIANDDNSLLISPKIGSEVLIMSQSGNLSEMVVIKTDAVEKITFKKDDFEFKINASTKKVTLKNSNANLATLINDLIDKVASAQIITQTGGTGTLAPTTITQLNQIKTMFNLILNTD